MKPLGTLALFLFLLIASLAGAESLPCQGIYEVCSISGSQGEDVSCPLMLVRAKASLTAPSGLDLRLDWDAARVAIQPFTYPFCVGATCFPASVPSCNLNGCTWGSLPTGHSVVGFPGDFSEWQNRGSLMIVHLSATGKAITSAYLDEAGNLVGTDAIYLTAHFRLLEDIPAEAPVSIKMSDINFATAAGVKLPFTVRQLPAGRAFVVDANTPPLVEAGADQTVAGNAAVTLDGSGSCHPFKGVLTYEWKQIAGPAVVLSDPHAIQPTFSAPPGGAEGNSLTFALTVAVKWGLSASDTVSVRLVLPGDVDNNTAVDLTDAILALQVLAGITPAAPLWLAADLNGDQRIGMEEALYVLQKVAGLR